MIAYVKTKSDLGSKRRYGSREEIVYIKCLQEKERQTCVQDNPYCT